MGFIFRKRIKILPGITLNVSKSGLSTTIGPKGAKFTLGGKRGPRATVGLPDTGLSYSKSLKKPRQEPTLQLEGRIGISNGLFREPSSYRLCGEESILQASIAPKGIQR